MHRLKKMILAKETQSFSPKFKTYKLFKYLF